MAHKQRCTIISCRRVLSTSCSSPSVSSPLRSYGGSPPQLQAIRCPLTASWRPDTQRPQWWVSAQHLPCCLSPAHPLCEGLVILPLWPFAPASSVSLHPGPLAQPAVRRALPVQPSGRTLLCKLWVHSAPFSAGLHQTASFSLPILSCSSPVLSLPLAPMAIDRDHARWSRGHPV